MKKLLFLLLLISAGVHGQIIDLSDYAKKSELEKVNKRLEALEKGIVTPPVDTLKPCDRDPSIGNIYNVTSTSATVQFDASKVFGLTLSLPSVDNSTKAFKPTSSTLYYTLPKLSPGEYEIIILPTTCKLKGKASVKKFTVPKETGDGGGVDPPIGADCDPKPTFVIDGYSSSSATIKFNANGLFDLTLSLLDALGATIASKAYHPDGNTLYFPFGKVLPDGVYKIKLTPITCNTKNPDVKEFTVKNTGGIINPPPASSGVVGTYLIEAGGREFTYTGNEKFKLAFNDDGTITDATPGIDRSGNVDRLDGKNVFYGIGYSIWGETTVDGEKKYKKFQNVKLPDGVYVLKQIATSAYSNISDVIRNLDVGINTSNSVLSEIILAIRTNGVATDETNWVRASRKLHLLEHGMSFIPDGTFGMSTLNKGETQAQYQAIGVNTDLILRDNGAPQPYAWKVIKWPADRVQPTKEELFNAGAGAVQQFGMSKSSIIMDEIPENTQGTDPNIDSKMPAFYAGALSVLRRAEPDLKVEDTGLFGPYGIDDFNGTTNRFIIQQPRQYVLEALTNKVHYVYNSGTWVHPGSYYMDDHISVRNMNLNYYMYNSNRNIPYELLIHNERVKVGTKTWQGQDRERKWMVVTATTVQNLLNDPGKWDGLEFASTRETIPYKNGEIAVKNISPAGLADEFLTLGFYSTWIGGGIGIWGGWTIGSNPDHFNHFTWYPQDARWTPKGGSQEVFVSGRNGAPIALTPSDPEGIEPVSQTIQTDAAYAGWKLAKKLKSRSAKISHATYSSSLGRAVPSTGSSGLHLNGFGPLNMGLLATKDLFDSKKGLMLVGEGPDGNVAVYYNGFLSQDESEDNVTVEFNGKSYNMGKCFGRKIYTYKF